VASAQTIEALRTALFKASDPSSPLPAGDSRYVDCGEERGTQFLLRTIRDAIDTGGDVAQLLCGNRGCGKTTELFRLQKELEANWFVVYLDADSALDLNDVDGNDLVLAIAAGVWDALKEHTSLDLAAPESRGSVSWLRYSHGRSKPMCRFRSSSARSRQR